MYQNNQLTDKKNTPKTTKKHFFILIIGGIIATFLLVTVIFLVKKSNSKSNRPANEKETNPETNLSTQEPPFIEEESNCLYLKEQNLTTHSDKDSKLCKMLLHEKDLPKWRQITQGYIIKLWKKGYHWHDIIQLWGWKIPEVNIPDLKAKKEVGVVNTLSYLLGLPCSVAERIKTMPEEEKEMWFKKMKNGEIGSSTKTIFIVRKSSTLIINFDEKIQRGAGPYGDTLKYVKKLIEFVFKQENINPNEYEITVLNCMGVENFEEEGNIKHGIVMGKSIGIAYCLALLSSIHQKPINQAVAATGVINLKERKVKINEQETHLFAGATLPISGLKAKSIAANEKEINCLILSKYQSSPHLLSVERKTSKEWIKAEDFQEVVLPKIKAKMQVYWAESVKDLRELILGGELS